MKKMNLFETVLYGQFTLIVEPELKFDRDKIKTIKKFLHFCCDELGLSENFTCKIVADRKANNVTTTAFYDSEGGLIVIYGKNRMLGDILRSVGHELTHKKQFENNDITDPIKDGADGSEIENDANAMAGILIRKFGRSNPNIFECKL